MRRILRALTLIAATGPTAAVAAPAQPCAADAERQALALLRFRGDGDARATVDPASVRSVGTAASPVGTRRFRGIEVGAASTRARIGSG